MQDFEADGEPMLTKIDYLTDMFDLEVQNERGKPIVIILREKEEHHTMREPRCPECGGILSVQDQHTACLDALQSRADT